MGVALVVSKREKYIGILAIGAIALLTLDQFVLSPYLDQLDSISLQQSEAITKLAQANELFAQKNKLKKVWDQMRGGVKTDESDARSQAEHALVDWSQWAGVGVTSSKSNISTKSGAFQVLNYEIGGNTSMAAAARMLWSLEQSPIPFRVNEIELSSRPEGTDSLNVRLSVSTISMPTDQDSSHATTAPTTTNSADKSAGDEQ
jgi:hypothetical protein